MTKFARFTDLNGNMVFVNPAFVKMFYQLRRSATTTIHIGEQNISVKESVDEVHKALEQPPQV